MVMVILLIADVCTSSANKGENGNFSLRNVTMHPYLGFARAVGDEANGFDRAVLLTQLL